MCKKTANYLFKDKTNIYVSECLSTNDFLTHLTKKNNLGEGTTVMTDYQVKGKGQRNNMWESKKKKNLLFSLLLKPDIPLSDQFKLHIIISLAIKETLTKLDLRGVKVKWPNDIYINDKKISGILIESQIFNKKIKQVVIGIGLNINQNNFDDLNATSILKETGNKSDIKYIPTQAEIGDYALFLGKASIEIKIEGKDYLIVSQSAILILIRDDIGRVLA